MSSVWVLDAHTCCPQDCVDFLTIRVFGNMTDARERQSLQETQIICDLPTHRRRRLRSCATSHTRVVQRLLSVQFIGSLCNLIRARSPGITHGVLVSRPMQLSLDFRRHFNPTIQTLPKLAAQKRSEQISANCTSCTSRRWHHFTMGKPLQGNSKVRTLASHDHACSSVQPRN